MRRPDGISVTVPMTVEFEDVDAYGIANHARIVSYLERARVRLLSHLGLSAIGGETHLVMYDLAVRYRKTLALLDALEVTASVKSADELRLVIAYSIRKEGVLAASATTSLAFVDGRTKALVPFPAALQDALRDQSHSR